MNNDDASLHEYPTFNGMGRSAMMFGIPIMALVLASVGGAILALIAGTLFGNKGFLVAIVVLPVLLMIRTISAKDDQAIRILGYEMFCLFKRRNAKLFWKTNTVIGTKLGTSYHDYRRVAKEYSQQSNQS